MRPTHFYMCSHCSYVNIKYQEKEQLPEEHALSLEANRFSVDKSPANNCEESMKNLSRVHEYVCKICSQICAAPEELNRHCDKVHWSTAASSNTSKTAPGLCNGNAKNTEKLCHCHKSGPKVSFSNYLSKYVAKASPVFLQCPCVQSFISAGSSLESIMPGNTESRPIPMLDKGSTELTNHHE